jgi:hypothetical protein
MSIPVGDQFLPVSTDFLQQYEQTANAVIIAERVWVERKGQSLLLHLGPLTVVGRSDTGGDASLGPRSSPHSGRPIRLASRVTVGPRNPLPQGGWRLQRRICTMRVYYWLILRLTGVKPAQQ